MSVASYARDVCKTIKQNTTSRRTGHVLRNSVVILTFENGSV